MDVLASVNVIETLLHGSESFTFSRQSVISLSLCVCLNPNIVKGIFKADLFFPQKTHQIH